MIRRSTLFRGFDFLSSLLLLQQFLERIFILIFKLLRLDDCGVHDMRGKFQHVLWNFFIRYISEIFLLFADLIGISQCKADQAVAARFQGDDVFAGGKDNPPERNYPLLADRIA